MANAEEYILKGVRKYVWGRCNIVPLDKSNCLSANIYAQYAHRGLEYYKFEISNWCMKWYKFTPFTLEEINSYSNEERNIFIDSLLAEYKEDVTFLFVNEKASKIVSYNWKSDTAKDIISSILNQRIRDIQEFKVCDNDDSTSFHLDTMGFSWTSSDIPNEKIENCSIDDIRAIADFLVSQYKQEVLESFFRKPFEGKKKRQKKKFVSNVEASKYVVLDVETNGLSSKKRDLLSLSIYKPDTEEIYDRFLPLELNSSVVTTEYNGIKDEDLADCLPLSQPEVDSLIQKFDLKNRTILTYGNIDETFLRQYFKRHKLKGIEYCTFYNFKHDIVSSKYSEGNITKDNLCLLYGIDNVSYVHSSKNDCVLEWRLFERMNGNKLLITNSKVFELNDQYIVPASYISTYPNFKYYLKTIPSISCSTRTIFSLQIPPESIIKFPTNFNGLILEHVINLMTNVEEIDSRKQLIENKNKLKYIGELPSVIDYVPIKFSPDGMFVAHRPQDTELIDQINSTVIDMKTLFESLVDFIKTEIFDNQPIKSQELVINDDKNVLALCDLSNDLAVLEIKSLSAGTDVDNYATQLYYEANGRKCYVLVWNWYSSVEPLTCEIQEITFNVGKNINSKVEKLNKAKALIETDEIELLHFSGVAYPVVLKCKSCGNEWSSSYNMAKAHKPCPVCKKRK